MIFFMDIEGVLPCCVRSYSTQLKMVKYYKHETEHKTQHKTEPQVVSGSGKGTTIPTEENMQFYRAIQKLRKLGLTKLLSIRNKLLLYIHKGSRL